MGREPHAEASIEDLLRRARGGDHGALAALFERSRPALERWASSGFARVHPGGARPSDIAQETAMRAYDQFAIFSGTTEKEWMAWLHRVFRSRSAQLIRDARRQKRESPGTVEINSPEATAAPAPQTSPSQTVAAGEEWRRMYTFIFELPDAQREAIWLCHLKETPIAEVAAKMRRTEPAVAGLVQRGLKALRARMNGEPDDGAESSGAPQPRSAATDALLAYLQRRAEGKTVDTAAFIAEHPDGSDELRAMLDWIARIEASRPR